MREAFSVYGAAIRSSAPFLLIVAAYALAASLYLRGFGLPQSAPASYMVNAFLYGAAAIVTLLVALPAHALVRKSYNPIRALPDFYRDLQLADRIIFALPAIIGVLFLGTAFTGVKSAIPHVVPFSFDPWFADVDAMLHGGDAWLLIQPLVGYPIVSFVINFIYDSWLLALYFVFLLFALWMERPRLRQQFLVSYALCWIVLGSIAATLMASVGPCFYDDFFGSDRYAPLMQYLGQASAQYPMSVLEVQQRLLDWSDTETINVGRGISAMPSMHISIAMLYALAGARISRFWGWVGAIYTLLILVGSVHLGYHYAIDGYLSIIATAAIWFAVGRAQQYFKHKKSHAPAN